MIATGETRSLKEFVETAFGEVGLDWRDHTDFRKRSCGRRTSPRDSVIHLGRANPPAGRQLSYGQVSKAMVRPNNTKTTSH